MLEIGQVGRLLTLPVTLSLLAACSSTNQYPVPFTRTFVEKPADPKGIATIEQVLVPGILGVDLAYFENIVGPARRTGPIDNEKQYRLGACDVNVGVGGGQVQWFEVDAVPECSFDLYAFLNNFAGEKAPIQQITGVYLEDVARGTASYLADCLSGCGNAADPVVYQHWQGSRADDFIEIRTSFVLAGVNAITASEKWENAMLKKESEQWIFDRKFNCSGGDARFFPAARNAFKNVKITSIAVGHGIPLPDCE